MREPFTIRHEGPITFLELDSPGSTVNVLTRVAAQQLNEFFSTKGSPERKLIVFRSRKPFSFLNGTELLLTHQVNNLEDLARCTDVTRSAYENVARSPVPTVAVIEGNCYGCGVEFALCCDHRVASDSVDTHFYMTELKDYFLLPLYGASWRLPRLVGLPAAADLLLWGERWSAEEARQFGLVDRVLGSERFDGELDSFLRELLEKGPSKRQERIGASKDVPQQEELERVRRHSLERISLLPPDQQGLHRTCLDLLFEAVGGAAAGRRSEPRQFVETLTTERSRKAVSFFFLRTMARVASIGTSSRVPPNEVSVLVAEGGGDPFQEVLVRAKLKGLNTRYAKGPLAPTLGEGVRPASFLLKDPTNGQWIPVWVEWGWRKAFDPTLHPLLYFPGGREVGLCELVWGDKSEERLGAFRSLLVLLMPLGWEPLVVRGGESVINDFLATYFGSVEELLRRGASGEDLGRTLWSFGFEDSPCRLRERFWGEAPPTWPRESRSGKDDPSLLFCEQSAGDPVGRRREQNGEGDGTEPAAYLLAGLFLPLWREAMQCLQTGRLRHRSQVDVIMRLVLGFPLSQGGFSDYMEQQGKA